MRIFDCASFFSPGAATNSATRRRTIRPKKNRPISAKKPTMMRRMGRSSSAVEAVVFVVRHHVDGVGHAVRHVEESYGLSEVEDVFGGESYAAQRVAVGLADIVGCRGQLPGEVEH